METCRENVYCFALRLRSDQLRQIGLAWHGRDAWYFCFWLLHDAVVLNSFPADLRRLEKIEILLASPGLESFLYLTTQRQNSLTNTSFTMTRKSKQAGGHMPLTASERKKYSKGYGTTTARLNGISQYTFGHCALSLHSAKEKPVATPSGHIYEKAAILEYLLTKTQELKQQKHEFERFQEKKQDEKSQEEEEKRKAKVQDFEQGQKVVSRKRQKVEVNPLKLTSYWLAEFQPEAVEPKSPGNAPPKRPSSPNSLRPLSRKDLIELNLKRNSDGQVICAISEKSITTQQAIALITKKSKTAEIVLEEVYNDLGKERMCPVTGEKISKILRLQKGGSSFAATGGVVEAKIYRPTPT
jgi:nitric oxide synthase-interacting protein